MSEDMQQEVIDCANSALEKFAIEKDIASCEWRCKCGRPGCS